MGFDGSDVRGRSAPGWHRWSAKGAQDVLECRGEQFVRGFTRWPRREASAAQLLRCSSVNLRVCRGRSRGRHHGVPGAETSWCRFRISNFRKRPHKARAGQRWSDGAARRQAALEIWGASQRHPLRDWGAAADRLWTIWIFDDGTTLAAVVRQPSCRRRFRRSRRTLVGIPPSSEHERELPTV